MFITVGCESYLGFGRYDIMIYKPLPRHKDWNVISTSPFASHSAQSSKKCIGSERKLINGIV